MNWKFTIKKYKYREGAKPISLEAMDMGRSLYERYGFVGMDYEMELPRIALRKL